MSQTSTSFMLDSSLKEEIEGLLVGSETISQFAYKATVEKVKRLQQRDERARLQVLRKDIAALRPVVRAILDEGPLEQ